MCVVKESVADGICDGGFTDVIVPLGHGELAGEDRGLVPVAILDDLEEISALGFGDPHEPPVVDHEDIDPGDLVCLRNRGNLM